jgi:N-acetylneuraminic acid mutarotase
VSHTATLLGDGRVLVTGGREGIKGTIVVTDRCAIFDPRTETWSCVASMGSPRYYHATAFLPDGRVVVVAGRRPEGSSSKVLRSTEVYDPGSGIWEDSAELETGRLWHTATALLDGRVLVVGGEDDKGATLGSVEILGPDSP